MLKNAFSILTVIFLLNTNLLGQEFKCNSDIYFNTETPVKCEGGKEFLTKYLNAHLTSNLKKSLTAISELDILVNCKGEVSLFKPDENLKKTQIDSFINVLNRITWIPGTQVSSPVNSIVKVKFSLSEGKLACDCQLFPIENVDISNFHKKLEELKNPVDMKIITGAFVDSETKKDIKDVSIEYQVKINSGKHPEYTRNKDKSFKFEVGKEDIIILYPSHVNYKKVTFQLFEQNSYSLELEKAPFDFGLKLDLTERTPDQTGFQVIDKAPDDFSIRLNLSTETSNKTQSNINNIEPISERILNAKSSINAQFKYGYSNAAFLDYFVKNYSYPFEAYQNKYRGSAKISFTINKEGKVENISIDKKLEYGLDTICLEILEKMPQWTPAIQKNENKSQDFVLEILFGPNKYWRKKYKN